MGTSQSHHTKAYRAAVRKFASLPKPNTVPDEIRFDGEVTDLVHLIMTEKDSKCRYWMLRALVNMPDNPESEESLSLDEFKQFATRLLLDTNIVQNEKPQTDSQGLKVEETLAAVLYLPDLTNAFEKFFPKHVGLNTLLLGVVHAHVISEENSRQLAHSLSLNPRANSQMAQMIRELTNQVVIQMKTFLGTISRVEFLRNLTSDTKYVLALQSTRYAIDICDSLSNHIHDIEGDEIWRDSALAILASGSVLLQHSSMQHHLSRLYDAILSPNVSFHSSFDALMFQKFGFERDRGARSLDAIDPNSDSDNTLDTSLSDDLYQRCLKAVFRKLANPCSIGIPFPDALTRSSDLSIVDRIREIFLRYRLHPRVVSSICKWVRPTTAAIAPWLEMPHWGAQYLVTQLLSMLVAVLINPEAVRRPRPANEYRATEAPAPLLPGMGPTENYVCRELKWYMELIKSAESTVGGRVKSLADLAALVVVEHESMKKVKKVLVDADTIVLRARATLFVDALSRVICPLLKRLGPDAGDDVLEELTETLASLQFNI